ncbi:hypothetical protein SDC9_111628 [bioreactor metagenome]|uniref:Uncharacterized protein n=1 Tax=bioreactor metagenome TaxID=1076179 RepID=A0A645BH00_9ZZZZ
MPLGISKATTALFLQCLISRSTSPLGAPLDPVPRSESIKQSASFASLLISVSVRSLENLTVQFGSFKLIRTSRLILASPLYVSGADDNITLTFSPFFKKNLAAVKPSPPLFPGPAKIVKLCESGYLFSVSRAALVPAFSISSSDVIPYFCTASASACLTSSGS